MKLSKDITTEELMAIDYRYNYTEEQLIDDFDRLCKTTEYKTGSQFRPGLKICQHYFPNFWEIRDCRGRSFADAWNDYDTMDKVRLWGLKGMSNLWLSWIRRAVYMATGLPNSTMYRPHFAKQIIEMTGKRAGTLFDPCAGWAGRLLGTAAAGWNYVGCEPCNDTYEGLCGVRALLQRHGVLSNILIHNDPAEVVLPDLRSRKFDVVLTSPPYFNLEVYDSDEGQSYNKFTSYEQWRDNWLYDVIDQSLSLLVDDGLSAWNVMNTRKHSLVEDVISFHDQNGWDLETTVGFQSPLANIRKLKNKDVTYVFRKRASS